MRSWKMCPTSMPRTISSVPLPSGLGSPATTLRISATSRLGQIAAPVHAGEVIAVLVGAAARSRSWRRPLRSAMTVSPPGAPTRPERARPGAEAPRGSRPRSRSGTATAAWQLRGLDLVQHVVAAQQQSRRSPSVAAITRSDLTVCCGGDLEEAAHVLASCACPA